jgi:uncharacterized membrane protein YkvA (DUF1232 family)
MLRALWGQARVAVRLVREPLVPRIVKALLAVPALYVIFPFDVLPDVLPGLGQVDDLTIVLLGLQAFVRLCPPGAVRFHRKQVDTGRPYSPMPASDVVIDAEWRREGSR